MGTVQEAYLQNVQANYRFYCYHVHNHGRDENDLQWYPSRFHKFLCDKAQEFVEKPTEKAYEILILNAPPQHGKLCADETPVLTREGWKRHGDLRAGDEVISPTGRFIKVLNVMPKGYANRIVTMSNGEKIKVHENHEWVVYDRACKRERTVETRYMEGHIKGEGERGHNFLLPVREPIDCEDKELPENPYVLGTWLGDGAREKCIPSEYLTASKRQRLELLAGLIDTDGYTDLNHHRMVFTTAGKDLKDTFCELISTFGWRVTVCEYKPDTSSSGIKGKRVYWQIGFNPTEEIPCRIERNRLTEFSKQRRIAVCSIEEIPEERGNCITVEGGVYCVGKTLVPTHNSEAITATFPSWYLMRNPDKAVIVVSYGDSLAQRFGKKNLDKVKEFGGIFGVKLDKNKHNAQEFRIANHKGVMISAGYGSGLTGNPADLIVIDDPVKNRVEADSEADRAKKWSDYVDSIESRISAGGKIILIMTRWHEDDLAGRLMEHYADRTTVINLPCEAEENDPLGREIGDALCPEIGKDNAWLADFKSSHMTEEGVRSWNALYQGRPSAREGNMLKREWWQYYKHSDYEDGTLKFDTMMMSVDATFKDQSKNDYVAIQVWGKRGNKCYLVDSVNKHLGFPETVRAIKVMTLRYPKIGAKLIEDKANGSAIIQTLRDEIPGIIPVEPRGGKEARVEAVAFSVEAGNIYLPKDKQFTWEFIDQCAAFPNGKHDDMVDAMSQCLARLIHKRVARSVIRDMRKGSWHTRKKEAGGLGKGDEIHVI